MQRMDAECCIFMLFLRLRMLSEDWYTWMLTKGRNVRNEGIKAVFTRQFIKTTF